MHLITVGHHYTFDTLIIYCLTFLLFCNYFEGRRLFLIIFLSWAFPNTVVCILANIKTFFKKLNWIETKQYPFYCHKGFVKQTLQSYEILCKIFWEAPCWQCPLKDLLHFNLPTVKPLVTSVTHSLMPHPPVSSFFSFPDALASCGFWWCHLTRHSFSIS